MWFEWDEFNELKIEAKHGVSAWEVEDAFYNNPLALNQVWDEALGEMVYEIVGRSEDRILTVYYVIRGDRIRPATAFDANEKKRQRYERHERGTRGRK